MTVNQKRAVLYKIFDQTNSLTPSASTYATLLAALQAMTAASANVTQTGTVARTGADGAFVEFAQPSEFDPGPNGYAAVAGQFRDLYQESKTVLISAGTPAPTDPQIWDEMMFRLTPVREIGVSDFSALRCA